MGWQGLSKGLIIGLIVGLILGFGSGYAYKNLYAEAPVTSNNTATTADALAANSVAAQLDYQLRQSIKGAVSEHGFKPVFGTGVDRTSSATNKFLEKIGVATVVRAQGQEEEGCAQHRIDFVLNLMQKALKGNFDLEKDECFKSASITGKLDFAVYQGEGPHEITWNRVTFTLDITYTFISTNPDNDCKDETETMTIRRTSDLYWDGRKFHDDEPPGVQWELLCTDSVPIKWTLNNPWYDKEKCCGKPVPAPIETINETN
jgi:hypothetical protein